MSDNVPQFLRFKPFRGPRQFTFIDPDTGFKYSAKTKQDLIAHIVTYRAQNRLEELSHLNFVLENYWCTLPENCYDCEPFKNLPRGILASMKGAIVVLKNYMYKKFVSVEVANTRAAQCVKCPFNTFPDNDIFIEAQNRIAVASVGDRKAEHHDKLGECSACGCPLRAKIFYAGTLSFAKQEKEALQSVQCWQLKLEKR